jgi:hypothetical protein
VVNIRRQSDCTIIIDRNEKFPELQAIMMQGQGQISFNGLSRLSEVRQVDHFLTMAGKQLLSSEKRFRRQLR